MYFETLNNGFATEEDPNCNEAKQSVKDLQSKFGGSLGPKPVSSARATSITKRQRIKSDIRSTVMGRKGFTHTQRRIGRGIFGMIISTLVFPFMYYLILNGDLVTQTERLVASLTVTVGACLVVTLGCIISRRITCVICLSFPTLMTTRGRAILLAVLLTMMVKGPVGNIRDNVDEVVVTIVCSGELVSDVMRNYVNETVDMGNNFENLAESMQKQTETLISQIHQKVKAQLNTQSAGIDNVFQSIKKSNNDIWKGGRAAAALVDVWKNKHKLLPWNWGKIGKFEGGSNSNKMDRIIAKAKEEAKSRLAGVGEYVDDCGDTEYVHKIEKQVPKLLNEGEVKEIVAEILTAYHTFHDSITFAFMIIRKLLYVTIIYMFYSAVSYLFSFYCDDAYDNKRIDYNLTRAWTEGNEMTKDEYQKKMKYQEKMEKILPLRRWEKKYYQYRWRSCPNFEEVRNMIVAFLPIIIFICLLAGVAFVDRILYEAIQLVSKNAKTTVAVETTKIIDGYAGHAKTSCVEEFKEPFELVMRGFNVSTSKCSPNAKEPNEGQFAMMVFILCCTAFSAIAESYTLRLRPLIASFFYPKRALERAVYLHNAISKGRGARRLKFHKLIEYEFYTRRRKQTFSLLWRLLPAKLRPNLGDRCPTCNYKFSDDEEKNLYSDKYGEDIFICNDCLLDVDVGRRSVWQKVRHSQTVNFTAVS